uniref:Uncharacterized protein n=1 Tax=Oryctolagus cuniculus TaxID=9986 RepID=A0A5F9DJ87_RABIT
MRHNYNQLYLSPANRPQITHCLFISEPHSPSNRSHPYSNTMKLYRRHRSNNRTWPYFLIIILPSQFQLRAHSQPNHTTSPRPTDYSSANSSMMTSC